MYLYSNFNLKKKVCSIAASTTDSNPNNRLSPIGYKLIASTGNLNIKANLLSLL